MLWPSRFSSCMPPSIMLSDVAVAASCLGRALASCDTQESHSHSYDYYIVINLFVHDTVNITDQGFQTNIRYLQCTVMRQLSASFCFFETSVVFLFCFDNEISKAAPLWRLGWKTTTKK